MLVLDPGLFVHENWTHLTKSHPFFTHHSVDSFVDYSDVQEQSDEPEMLPWTHQHHDKVIVSRPVALMTHLPQWWLLI